MQYRGRTYSPVCLSVHDSRIGRVILDDGGETEYRGARRIRGLPTRKAFLLLGGACGKGTVAVAKSFMDQIGHQGLGVPVPARRSRS